ncbi:MAG: hypothetical protein ACK56I_29415, partial [bacterium]
PTASSPPTTKPTPPSASPSSTAPPTSPTSQSNPSANHPSRARGPRGFTNRRAATTPDRIGLGKFLRQRFMTLFPPTYRRLLANHSAPAPVMRSRA